MQCAHHRHVGSTGGAVAQSSTSYLIRANPWICGHQPVATRRSSSTAAVAQCLARGVCGAQSMTGRRIHLPMICPTSPCPSLPHQRKQRDRVRLRSSAASAIVPLGFDLLTFLGSTVVMVPLFKKLQISPVLGFLLCGILLHQYGLIRDPKDMEALSELGVLFLLFEMGLELSLDRLKALAKYAFGLGTLQMLVCTGIFTAFALPAGSGLGTHLLEWIANAPSSLVSIRSVDEAVVIAGALSMSSSAFVLQLLSERGEMPTRVGSATLGILLLQDIAVVPFLVLLPLFVQLQAGGTVAGVVDPSANPAAAVAAAAAAGAGPGTLVAMLGPTVLKTCAGLGLLLVGGRLLLRRVFELVAQSDNSETFVGLCLLTVAGAALLTQRLGLSDTMGAFIAGVLLSESNYKTQVEADIRPFRGLLLGLFFVTTGSSIDMAVLRNNWEVIAWILAGLLTIKTSVIAALGPTFGLSRSESIRTGFMLSQGGEFAFVLLSLASSLHVLPDNLNQVLIIVVVISMALTPYLAEAGKVVGEWLDEVLGPQVTAGGGSGSSSSGTTSSEDTEQLRMLHAVAEEPVVICGFGPHGQMLAALLDRPLASLPDPRGRAYIAFDLDPTRVQAARSAGLNCVYGDGTRAAVLKAAGVKKPRAIAVCLTSNQANAHRAVASLRTAYPTVPIYALGTDIRHAAELQEAGADHCVMATTSSAVDLGEEMLVRLGASVSEAAAVGRDMQASMQLRAQVMADRVARYGSGVLDDDPSIHMLTPGQYNSMVAQVAAGRGSTGAAAPPAAAGMVAAYMAPAPDTMPSMQGAMPASYQPSSSSPASSSASSTLQSDVEDVQLQSTVSALVAAADREAKAAYSSNDLSSESMVPAQRSTPRDGTPSAGRAIPRQNAIAATASAQLDCGGDEVECTAEEVAGLVVVDASKQQRANFNEASKDAVRQPSTPGSSQANSPTALRGSNGRSSMDESDKKQSSSSQADAETADQRQPVSVMSSRD